jgi:hypothetical protein
MVDQLKQSAVLDVPGGDFIEQRVTTKQKDNEDLKILNA